MRIAILTCPNAPDAAFSVPTEPTAIRRHLVHRTGRLVPVVGHLPFDQVLHEHLDLQSPAEDGTLVLWVGPHVVLDAEAATELELDDHFEMAEKYVDEEVDQAMAEAYEAADREDLDGARRTYSDIDRLLGQEDSPRHALVLVSLGEIERLAGRSRQAAALFDRALAIAPDHIGALRGRAELALAGGESAIAAAMHFRLVPHLDNDEQRLEALSQVASESLRAAKDAMARALELRPEDPELLERLKAIHEASGEYAEAVGLAVRIAEKLSDPKQRARSLVQAGRMASEKAENTSLAVALYEAAIEDDPEATGAFEAVEAELLRTADFLGVARAYERQLERLLARDAAPLRIDLLRRLARVQHEELGDPRAAIGALDRLVLEQPRDGDAQIQLAALLRETDQLPLATRVLQVAANLMPGRAETYRSLLGLLDKLNDTDRTFNCAAVLVALGEADINEQLRYAQYAPETLLGITSTVDDDIWDLLQPTTHPVAVHELVLAIEDTALEIWFAERAAASPSMPPPTTRQNPQNSTVGAVRAFAWVARILGLPEPAIHVIPEADTLTAATLPCREPAVALGRHALTGRSLPELAFMAAHHLAFFRPGFRILPFYSEVNEVVALVRAAAAVARPELASGLDQHQGTLRQQLDARLDPTARASLATAVDRVLAEDGKLDVLEWLRAAETIACRAALLVSGDVTVAGNVLAVAGVAPGGRSPRDRLEELLPFAVSQNHTALRHLLGVAVG
jgi:tetratricopeptide (TPR) repeat protein